MLFRPKVIKRNRAKKQNATRAIVTGRTAPVTSASQSRPLLARRLNRSLLLSPATRVIGHSAVAGPAMLRAEAPAGAPPCRIHVVTPEAPDGGKGCVGLLDTDKQNLYATHYWLDHVLRPMQRRFLWPKPATADLIFLNASFRCRVPRPLTLHLSTPSTLTPVGTRQGPAPAALRLLRAAAEDGIAEQHKDDFRSRLQHQALPSLCGPQRLYEAEHQPGPAKHPLARDGPLPRPSRLDAAALAFRTL